LIARGPGDQRLRINTPSYTYTDIYEFVRQALPWSQLAALRDGNFAQSNPGSVVVASCLRCFWFGVQLHLKALLLPYFQLSVFGLPPSLALVVLDGGRLFPVRCRAKGMSGQGPEVECR
jgi:hypothetical protein